jgi:feruloyl esterase
MPASNWNGKLQAVGNGAWAGAIGYARARNSPRAPVMRRRLPNTGHVGNTAKFVPGHPEKMVDYGPTAPCTR